MIERGNFIPERYSGEPVTQPVQLTGQAENRYANAMPDGNAQTPEQRPLRSMDSDRQNAMPVNGVFPQMTPEEQARMLADLQARFTPEQRELYRQTMDKVKQVRDANLVDVKNQHSPAEAHEADAKMQRELSQYPGDPTITDLESYRAKYQHIDNFSRLDNARADLQRLMNAQKVDAFSNDLKATVEALDANHRALSQKQWLEDQARGGLPASLIAGGTERSDNPAGERLYAPLTPIKDKITERLDILKSSENAYSLDEKRKYYKELKRYVKIVLDNGERGTLKLNNQQNKNILEAIMSDNPDSMNESDLLNRVNDMENVVHLSNFFGNLKRDRQSGYLPENVDELMELIGQNWPNFQTTGEFELIDGEGNIRVENFWYWMRERMMEWHEGNPYSTNADYLTQNVMIRTNYSQISLLEILLSPRYMQKQDIIIEGEDPDLSATTTEGAPAARQVAAYYKTVGIAPELASTRNKMMGEAWLAGLTHNYDANYKLQRAKDNQVAELLANIGVQNSFTRDNNMFKPFMLPSADSRDVRDYTDYRSAGKVGQAIQKMTLMWYYLSEFTDLYEEEHYDEKTKQWVRDYPQGMENIFYKVAGAEGVNAIFKSIASDALTRSLDAKKAYRDYVKEMIVLEKERYQGNDRALRVIDKELDKFKKDDYMDVEKQDGVKVNLDYLPELEKLKQDIFKELHGKALPNPDQKEAMRKETQDAVNKYIKDKFLKKLNLRPFDTQEKRGDKKVTVMKHVNMDNFSTESADKAWASNREFANELLQALVGGTWKELNVFNDPKKQDRYFKLVENAIQQGGATGLNLSDQDKKYAAYWATTLRNWTGIAARNDTIGIGFDAWAKLINYQKYRIRGSKGRTGSGNLANVPGVKSLSMTLWDGVKVFDPEAEINSPEWQAIGQIADDAEREKAIKEYKARHNHTFIEILQGGRGDNVHVDDNHKVKMGELEGNALSQFADIHIASAFKTMKLLNDDIHIHIGDIATQDVYGNFIFDQKKAQELMSEWWKTLRYAYDQYDFDYDQEIYYQGHKMTLREYFFNKEVQNMGMYERKEAGGQKKGQEKNMARNIFAYLLAKEIYEHVIFNRTQPLWTASNLRLIEAFFRHFPLDIEKEQIGAMELYEVSQPFFTKEEWRMILQSINQSYFKMGVKDAGLTGIDMVVGGGGKALGTLLSLLRPH